MSGYEGEGTFEGDGAGADFGSNFNWGASGDVADSNIGSYGGRGSDSSGAYTGSGFSGFGLSLGSSGLGLSASPGAGLSLAAPSSPGISVSASQFADFGPADAPGLDVATAGAVQSASAQLAIAESAAASAKAAAEAKTVAAVKSGMSLVPGGGLLVAAVDFVGQLVGAIGSAFTGGAGAGNVSNEGTSVAPELFSGGDGPPDTGFTGGAPVLGFGGSAVNNPPQTSSGGGVVNFPGLNVSHGAGFGPGGGLQYGAGFVPGAQQSQPSAAPLLLLAGAASLLFMG